MHHHSSSYHTLLTKLVSAGFQDRFYKRLLVCSQVSTNRLSHPLHCFHLELLISIPFRRQLQIALIAAIVGYLVDPKIDTRLHTPEMTFLTMALECFLFIFSNISEMIEDAYLFVKSHFDRQRDFEKRDEFIPLRTLPDP